VAENIRPGGSEDLSTAIKELWKNGSFTDVIEARARFTEGSGR